MRWERMLTTGARLVVSGRQIVLSQPSPQGAVVEDVSWWSNERLGLYLETFAVGGFDRSGFDGELLAQRLQGRTPLPWATLELDGPLSADLVGAEFDVLLTYRSAAAARVRWTASRGGSGVFSIGRESVSMGAIQGTATGVRAQLSSDRRDAALLLYGAVLFACRKGECREASISLRMLNGAEHECNPLREAFAARTQLELLGIRLPLDAALAWFPVHKLAITGEIRTTSEDAIVIDF
jgi:hypothetical protein